MSDHDALLEAIIANPDDDTVRLVFADWLDEHADTFPASAAVRSRAQFIRDDIAMSQCDEFDRERLQWELIEKPRREGERWVNATLPELPRGLAFWREPLFRRGFPWSVRSASNARQLPEPPVGAFPLERVYYERCGAAGVDQLCAAPWRWQLRAIGFEYDLPSTGARRLFALGGLDRLERLEFRRSAIDPEVRDLLTAPLFGRLSSLTITGAPVGTLLAGQFFLTGPRALRELHLIGCRLTPTSLETVLAVHAPSKLESLSAGGDRIGAPEKFRAFGRASLPPLRTLDMSNDSPKEAGLEALVASPLVSSLRRLALASCNLNGDRTRVLVSGAFANLRTLDLSCNSVGNEGATALARSPHLAGLLILRLGHSQVGDEGILALLESPLADGLVFLDLVGSPASEETKELLVGRMGDRVRV